MLKIDRQSPSTFQSAGREIADSGGVAVRPCDWKAATAAGFKLLPTDGKPVSRWRSQDQALLDVTQGIRKVVQAIRKDPVFAKPAPRARAVKKPMANPRGRHILSAVIAGGQVLVVRAQADA
jgi:hypothetical protein